MLSQENPRERQSRVLRAEAAYDRRIARARLPKTDPKHRPYPVATRVAQLAYDRVMRGEPANGKSAETAEVST